MRRRHREKNRYSSGIYFQFTTIDPKRYQIPLPSVEQNNRAVHPPPKHLTRQLSPHGGQSPPHDKPKSRTCFKRAANAGTQQNCRWNTCSAVLKTKSWANGATYPALGQGGLVPAPPQEHQCFLHDFLICETTDRRRPKKPNMRLLFF